MFLLNQLVATPILVLIFHWIDLTASVDACIYWKHLQGHIWRTTKSVQKLSYNYTPKFIIPDVIPSVDALLTLGKGCLSFKQYLSLNSSHFGSKTFKLYKSHPGYLWSFIVYTGKETILNTLLISKDMPESTAIVLKFSAHQLHKGYTLWMDNYYKSPAVAKFLKLCHTIVMELSE